MIDSPQFEFYENRFQSSIKQKQKQKKQKQKYTNYPEIATQATFGSENDLL